MKDYPQVTFTESRLNPNRLTKFWNCHSKSGTHLGVVKWWAHWRRYCFFPANDLLFDCNCLWDIADFVKQQTEFRKEERAKR
jgi:hypothetical protein